MDGFTDELGQFDFAADFLAFAVGLLPVTLYQIDPDTGAVVQAADAVSATQLPRRRAPFGVAGGELGDDTCRFAFALSATDQQCCPWLPKARDQVIDATGVVWSITAVEIQGFGSICQADAEVKR